MASGDRSDDAGRVIVYELVQLCVDLVARSRIGQLHGLVDQWGEGVLDLGRDTLAGRIGRHQVGHVPVVRVVVVFLPAHEEDRGQLRLDRAQESRPRQSNRLNDEELIDRVYVERQELSDGLAGRVALVVASLHAEANGPDIAVGIFTGRDAVFIGISQFELFLALGRVIAVSRVSFVVAGHARYSQTL